MKRKECTWLLVLQGLSHLHESLTAVRQGLLLSLQGFPLRLPCCAQISITLCHALIITYTLWALLPASPHV